MGIEQKDLPYVADQRGTLPQSKSETGVLSKNGRHSI
jgi:hypothetical protein